MLLHHFTPTERSKAFKERPRARQEKKTGQIKPQKTGRSGRRRKSEVCDILWPKHHIKRIKDPSDPLEKPIWPGFQGRVRASLSSDRPQTARPYLFELSAMAELRSSSLQQQHASDRIRGQHWKTSETSARKSETQSKRLTLILQHLGGWANKTVWDGFLDRTFLARSFKGKFYSRLRLREIKMRRMRRICSMCSHRWAAFTTQEPSRIETAVDNQPVDLSSQAFGSSWTFTSNEQNQSNTGWYWKVISGAMESEWSRRLSRVEELEKARGVQ